MNSISRISATASEYQHSAPSPPRVQRANDLQAVQGALQSGDIKGAQKALAAFKQAQNTTPHTISANNAASALEALQAALLLGNLSAAQQAFANLQVQSSA